MARHWIVINVDTHACLHCEKQASNRRFIVPGFHKCCFYLKIASAVVVYVDLLCLKESVKR